MARTVTTIPATISRYTAAPINTARKRRVAGYARVSTDHEEQQSSYEAQMDYYTAYINGRDDWEFAGMYSDAGISATNTRHRDGFRAMVADALAGKIDLIITKSVSRFARNTVDSLTTVRQLKDKGIEVYFEKKDLWTEGVVKMLKKNQMGEIYKWEISSENRAVCLINVAFLWKENSFTDLLFIIASLRCNIPSKRLVFSWCLNL